MQVNPAFRLPPSRNAESWARPQTRRIRTWVSAFSKALPNPHGEKGGTQGSHIHVPSPELTLPEDAYLWGTGPSGREGSQRPAETCQGAEQHL